MHAFPFFERATQSKALAHWQIGPLLSFARMPPGYCYQRFWTAGRAAPGAIHSFSE